MDRKPGTHLPKVRWLLLGMALALLFQAPAWSQDELPEFGKTAYTYKSIADLKIEADVYRHKDAVKRPVVVWLHGGALIMGSRTGVPRQLLDLARQHGLIVVSLDYRLAPEAKLKDIIEDLKDGLQWVRTSGPSKFHADPSRMVVAGASAGGYLALMSALLVEPPPTAIVSYWGFGDVDGDWTTKPNEAYRKGKLIEKEQAWEAVRGPVLTGTNQANGRGRAMFFVYLKQTGQWLRAVSGLDPETNHKKISAYCPIRNVSAKYPPTLFLHGTADTDVPVEQSIAMVDELKRHGVEHELITIEGGGHSLWGGDRELIDKAFARSMEYIRERLLD